MSHGTFYGNTENPITIWEPDSDGDIEVTGEDFRFYIAYADIDDFISKLQEYKKVVETRGF